MENKESVELEIDDREDEKIFRLINNKSMNEFINKLKIDIIIKKERLHVGDYVIGNKSLCIERKTLIDFMGSVRSGRLFNQLLNMQEVYDYNYLLISGNISDLVFNPYLKSYSVNEYIGSIASIMARYNIKPFIIGNDTQLLKFMLKLIEKHTVKKDINVIKRIQRSKSDVYVDMLCCIPGLGEDKARAILEKYRFQDICRLKEADLCAISGIGKKISKNVLDCFI